MVETVQQVLSFQPVLSERGEILAQESICSPLNFFYPLIPQVYDMVTHVYDSHNNLRFSLSYVPPKREAHLGLVSDAFALKS